MDFLKNIFLVFLASFLFVGIIESYKNNESLNTEILKTYSKVKIKQSSCHKNHNNLFLSYYPLAGSFKLQKQELRKMIDAVDKGLSQGYYVFITSILKSTDEQKNNISSLKSETESCRSLLSIEYEDLAILLGVSDEYKKIFQKRSQEINNSYQQQQQIFKKYTKNIDEDQLLGMFKSVLNTIDTRIFDKNKTNEFESMFAALSDMYIALAENEQLRFNVESQTYQKLKRLYLLNIKKNLEKDFIDYVLELIGIRS